MRKFAKKAGPRAIGSFVDKSTRTALVRRGFAQSDILAKWASIVGPNLANASSPERFVYKRGKNHEATLKIRVTPGFAPEFQQFEPLIIERINSYFGYKAVARLSLIQAPIKKEKTFQKQQLPPPNKEQSAWLKTTLEEIEDEELRENLKAVGSRILGRKNLRDHKKN